MCAITILRVGFVGLLFMGVLAGYLAECVKGNMFALQSKLAATKSPDSVKILNYISAKWITGQRLERLQRLCAGGNRQSVQ